MEKVEKVVRVRFSKLTIAKNIELDDGKQDSASLTWSTRNGYPRITVYTSNNLCKDKDGKFDFSYIVTAPFDYITLQIFLTRFQEVIDSESEINYKINCYNIKFDKGVRTNDIYLQATVVVGKDKNGVIYLAAVEEGKRNIKFELLPSDKFFKFYDKDNNEISDKKVLSKLYATGYVKVLNKLLLDVAREDIVTQVDYTRPVVTLAKPKETEMKEETNNKDIHVGDMSLEDLF